MRVTNIIIMLEPINDLIRIAESDGFRLSDFLFNFVSLGKSINSWRGSDLKQVSFKIYLRRSDELDISSLLAAYSLDPKYSCQYLQAIPSKLARTKILTIAKNSDASLDDALSTKADYKRIVERVFYPLIEDLDSDSMDQWASLDRPLEMVAQTVLSVKSSRLSSFLTWNHSSARNRLDVDTLATLAKLRYFHSQSHSNSDDKRVE